MLCHGRWNCRLSAVLRLLFRGKRKNNLIEKGQLRSLTVPTWFSKAESSHFIGMIIWKLFSHSTG